MSNIVTIPLKMNLYLFDKVNVYDFEEDNR